VSSPSLFDEAAPVQFEELERYVQPPQGLIRAEWHRHRNPDGSLGGWVENTATVARTAYVGPQALVLMYARVLDLAKVLDEGCVEANSSIEDEVVVCERGVVSDSARLSGNCVVKGTARVRGNFKARTGVYSSGDHLRSSQKPLGRRRRPLGVLANGL
jgi:carbonic anhydrase/acetyltransferase-like protein (isoleucine patch superfamily)